VVSETKPQDNVAKNSKIKIEPAATPASEVEGLKSSTRFAQGRGATESPSELKGLPDEIAAVRAQAAPAAVPAAGSDSKAKSDRMATVAPPVAQPSSAGGLATTQQIFEQSAV